MGKTEGEKEEAGEETKANQRRKRAREMKLQLSQHGRHYRSDKPEAGPGFI